MISKCLNIHTIIDAFFLLLLQCNWKKKNGKSVFNFESSFLPACKWNISRFFFFLSRYHVHVCCHGNQSFRLWIAMTDINEKHKRSVWCAVTQRLDNTVTKMIPPVSACRAALSSIPCWRPSVTLWREGAFGWSNPDAVSQHSTTHTLQKM